MMNTIISNGADLRTTVCSYKLSCISFLQKLFISKVRYLSLLNESSFLWIDDISANFKESGKAPLSADSFVHLYKVYGNTL